MKKVVENYSSQNFLNKVAVDLLNALSNSKGDNILHEVAKVTEKTDLSFKVVSAADYFSAIKEIVDDDSLYEIIISNEEIMVNGEIYYIKMKNMIIAIKKEKQEFICFKIMPRE